MIALGTIDFNLDGQQVSLPTAVVRHYCRTLNDHELTYKMQNLRL